MPLPIYTFGYNRADCSIERIAVQLEEMDALLVDIRIKPSGKPAWRQAPLLRRFGPRYRHVPELGNSLFRKRVLAVDDIETGTTIVRDLANTSTLLMFCACEQYGNCHRKLVAEALQNAGLACSELKRLDGQGALGF